MDKFAQRLADDAAAIDSTVTPELRQRIIAARQATAPVAPQQAARRTALTLRLLGVATAMAAVAAVITWPPSETADDTPAVAATALRPTSLPSPHALRIEPVASTEPLQQELAALRADVAKARVTIEQDLRDSF